jgi:hypothetical protein
MQIGRRGDEWVGCAWFWVLWWTEVDTTQHCRWLMLVIFGKVGESVVGVTLFRGW